ncbi:MAG: putative spermidine/putrescine transport system substrate-binding protein [Arenicella sp.]|jgi:putative spermidine/putrescine transport system substrate-binding protein
MKRFRWSILLMVLALLLVACGGPEAPAPAAETGSEAEPAAEEAVVEEEATADRTVTLTSWGGAYQEAQTNAYLAPYAEETGVTVVQDGPTDYAKIIAMVEAGQVTWDIVDIENDFAIGSTEQYFEPIDYSIVDKDAILPGLADEFRVATILYATVIGYNTDEYAAGAPSGWADFFDPVNFPGTRSLPNRASRYVFEVALIADGVAKTDLYPLDIPRAISVLDRIKDDVIYWETGSQSAQQLADGEAMMGMLWNGRIQTAIDEGAPLAIQWNEHVALADYLAVPKGAPNKEEAMELIAYMVGSESNHRIADFISYAPVNVETFDKVNADMAPLLPTFEDRPSQGFIVNDAWWDENRDAVLEQYNAWLLGETAGEADMTDVERTVTLTSWGGAYQEAQTNAYLDPYAEETGVTVVQDGPTDYAKIVAMVEAGQVTWDIVDIENDFAIGSTEQYFEPIDYSIVDKDSILLGLANDYRVAVILYATVIGYNTDEYADAPQGWADFFDPENFPGTRSLPNRASRYIFEVALIADGVAPEDLYPLDIDRAITVLDRIKDDVIFWETGSQSAQQLADEEAMMGMLWNGRIQTAIDEGAPLAIQWNEHVVLADYLAVPKGAPNKQEAMELIAYMVGAQHNHKIADFISYAPVNVETFDRVNADMAPLLPTFEDRPSTGFQVDDAWWDENRDEVLERYNAWLLE